MATTKNYLCNAFSVQMILDLLKQGPVDVKFVPCTKEDIPADVVSAVGHPDTARVLGYPCNRISLKLEPGDTLYLAQLTGGRLPEGCTTLPEGFSFEFFKVTV